jgi:hypothetical protein
LPPAAPEEETVTGDSGGRSKGWLSLVVSDVQFWVPVAVLVAGLLVLRWIS